jgi:hypothetical protein
MNFTCFELYKKLMNPVWRRKISDMKFTRVLNSAEVDEKLIWKLGGPFSLLNARKVSALKQNVMLEVCKKN